MKRFLPSMFLRRALFLLAGAWAAFAILGVQVLRLAIVQGDEHAREAETKLIRRSWTPTIRGRILDRKGRILAEDRPSFDVTVDYGVLSGEWARVQALRAAKRLAGERWAELDAGQRQAVANGLEPSFVGHVEAMKDLLCTTTAVDQPTLEARWAGILAEVDRIRASVMLRRWDREAQARLARGAELTEATAREFRRRLDRPIQEEASAHVLLPRIDDESGFRLLRMESETLDLALPATPWTPAASVSVPRLPGVSILNGGDRAYPLDAIEIEIDRSSFPAALRDASVSRLTVRGVAIHLLGWTRSGVTGEDVARRAADLARDPALAARARAADGTDRGQYHAGDSIGQGGVEGGLEPRLRGLRGLTTRNLEMGTEHAIAPQPGQDVALTIDIALQARIQALMDPAIGLAVVQPWHASDNPTMPAGAPIHGAAVVLDVDTGEILAMVSTPTFTRETLASSPELVFNDPASVPYLNKAIARPYPPGSIAKALVLCEAIARGNLAADSRIACTGHLFPDRPDMYRCWIFKRADLNTTHTIQFGGPINAVDGLMVSCNIFFFTLGQRLGVDGMTSAYRRFGVGERFALGVGTEYPGTIGASGDGSGLILQDAIQMGIGQGPVAWTPLHAADAYATIARGGERLGPTLLADAQPAPRSTGLSTTGARLAMDGLAAAVNDRRGTGHHITYDGRQQAIFNARGISVWGKTGTAEAPRILHDPDGSGPQAAQVVREGDHSWFVVLAGRATEGRPRYAIAVLMEYAGSGGKVSGPIANQIIQALIAEGYL